MQLLRVASPLPEKGSVMTKRVNDGTTHWEGCYKEHHDCALARLEKAESAVAALREALDAPRTCYEHAANCCSSWCDGCKAGAVGDALRESALTASADAARAHDERIRREAAKP